MRSLVSESNSYLSNSKPSFDTSDISLIIETKPSEEEITAAAAEKPNLKKTLGNLESVVSAMRAKRGAAA
jgi:hypothetical protein